MTGITYGKWQLNYKHYNIPWFMIKRPQKSIPPYRVQPAVLVSVFYRPTIKTFYFINKQLAQNTKITNH